MTEEKNDKTITTRENELTDQQLETVAGGVGAPEVKLTKVWGDPHVTPAKIGSTVTSIGSTVKGDGSV